MYIQCLADYKVSPADIAGITFNTANIIFDQQWEMGEKRNEYASTQDHNGFRGLTANRFGVELQISQKSSCHVDSWS